MDIKKIRQREYKVVIAFVSCLLVAFSTLGIAMKLSQKELKDEAYRMANIEAEIVKATVDILFSSTEWVMNSFLSSISDYDIAQCDGDLVTNRILRERDRRKLEIPELYEMLEGFISYNPELYSCILIFEPGVLANVPKGIAAAAYSDNTHKSHINLLDEYNVFGSNFYKSVAEAGKRQIKVSYVGRNELFVCTVGIPIFNPDKKKVVGQCWVDIVMDSSSKILSRVKFNNDVVSFLMAPDSRVICSSDFQYNGKYLRKVLDGKYPGDFPEEWYEKMLSVLKETGQVDTVFTAELNGEITRSFCNHIKHTKFTLVSVKPESRVFRIATNLQKTLMWIFVSAFLLLSFCLLYLFYAFRKENKAKDRLKRDLELAYEIQHSLLTPNPDAEPEKYDIYGFQQPAKSVGGDLFCHFEKGGKLHFCIGDVSGKGVPAALLMSEIISLYKYIASKKENFSDIMKALNDSSMDVSVNRNICTMIIGILDLETGHLEFCNAGHNPPVLLSDGQAEYISMKPNMPLYAFDNYPYVAESIDLKPGDKLFLYTDGVTDAMDFRKQMFGQGALLSAIGKNGSKSFPKAVAGILAAIAKFVGRMPQYDDISLLCIKYKGK